jgi:hypothetical protein
MATKILGPAIEHVIDNLVVLRAKGIGLLIIDNMLTKNLGDLQRGPFVVISYQCKIPSTGV